MDIVTVLMVVGFVFVGFWSCLCWIYQATNFSKRRRATAAALGGRSGDVLQRTCPHGPMPNPEAKPRMKAEPEAAPRPSAIEVAHAKIAALEMQINQWQHQAITSQARAMQVTERVADLISQNAVLERERDEWRSRANAGQSAAPHVANSNDPLDRSKFMRLRAVVVKCLHPDHCGGSTADKAVRGEMFKSIWPEIERIQVEV